MRLRLPASAVLFALGCGSPSAPPVTPAPTAQVTAPAPTASVTATAISTADPAPRTETSCAGEACGVECEAKNVAACARWARALADGAGVQKDPVAALAAARKACNGGIAEGCYVAGQVAVHDDTEAAGKLFKRACDGGFADGCAFLGVLAVDGRGVAKDVERAMGLFVKSCDAKSALGCHNLAFELEKGSHLVHDEPRALKLYEENCTRGESQDCMAAGRMQDEGRGTAEDETKAHASFERACSLGNGFGCDVVKEMDDRVHPIQKATVRVIQIGYAGPRFTHSQRPKDEAKKRAGAALAKLKKGEGFASVATEFDDPEPVRTSDREQVLVRRKTESDMLKLAFSLQAGKAGMFEHPLFGFMIVYRVK